MCLMTKWCYRAAAAAAAGVSNDQCMLHNVTSFSNGPLMETSLNGVKQQAFL
jgi:hypothetical protein